MEICRFKKPLVAYFTLQVFIPTMVYKGQKLITLVAKNTPPNTNKTTPNVPVTVPVKNRIAKTAARITLITLSAPPMFVFIFFYLIVSFCISQTSV